MDETRIFGTFVIPWIIIFCDCLWYKFLTITLHCSYHCFLSMISSRFQSITVTRTSPGSFPLSLAPTDNSHLHATFRMAHQITVFIVFSAFQYEFFPIFIDGRSSCSGRFIRSIWFFIQAFFWRVVHRYCLTVIVIRRCFVFSFTLVISQTNMVYYASCRN